MARIESGEIAKIDPMSLDLIPVRLKHQEGIAYDSCRECGIEYATDIIQRGYGYCPRCLMNGDEYECNECGTPMIYTLKEQFEGRKKHSTCPNCYEKNLKTYESRTCPIDGKHFNVTVGEYKFLTAKGYPIPERCPDCRKSANPPTGISPSIFPAHEQNHSAKQIPHVNTDGTKTDPPNAPPVTPPTDTAKHTFLGKLRRMLGY